MLGSLRPLPISTAIPQICGNWPKHQVHNSISALPHLGSLTMLKGCRCLKFKTLTSPDAIIMKFCEEKKIVTIIKCCFVWDLSWERRGLSLGWNAPRLLPDNERFTRLQFSTVAQSLSIRPDATRQSWTDNWECKICPHILCSCVWRGKCQTDPLTKKNFNVIFPSLWCWLFIDIKKAVCTLSKYSGLYKHTNL